MGFPVVSAPLLENVCHYRSLPFTEHGKHLVCESVRARRGTLTATHCDLHLDADILRDGHELPGCPRPLPMPPPMSQTRLDGCWPQAWRSRPWAWRRNGSAKPPIGRRGRVRFRIGCSGKGRCAKGKQHTRKGPQSRIRNATRKTE